MSGKSDRWLHFARQDLRMAELALREEFWNQACFHAEQCVEKALKSRLAERGEAPPRTHKLADLLQILGEKEFPEIADEIRALDRFHLPTREPDALPGEAGEGLPGEVEAREAMGVARAVMEGAKRGWDRGAISLRRPGRTSTPHGEDPSLTKSPNDPRRTQ